MQYLINNFIIFKTTDWVYGYLDGAKNKCKFTLTQDNTFLVTDASGNKVQDTTFLQTLCSNNCSNHGNCSSSGMLDVLIIILKKINKMIRLIEITRNLCL
jgi:hypothetical protein